MPLRRCFSGSYGRAGGFRAGWFNSPAHPVTFLERIWSGLGATSRRVAVDTAALLADRLVRLVLGFYVSAVVARLLGPDSFGEFSYGLAIGTIAAGIAQLGMDGVLIRELARRPAESGVLLATGTVLRFSGALVLWLAVFLAVISGCTSRLGGASPEVILVLALTAFSAVGIVPLYWFQAQGRTWQCTWTQLTVFLAVSAYRLWLVRSDGRVVDFAWAIVLEYAVAGAVAYMQVRRGGQESWRFSAVVAGELWRASWPMWIAAMAFLGYTRFDQILLGQLSGQRELGLYAVAGRLTEQASLLPAAMSVPLLGVLAVATSETQLRDELRHYGSICVLFAYLFVLGVWLAGPLFFVLSFGQAYAPAANIARIQILAAPLLAVGYARNQVLLSQGRSCFLMLTMLGGMVGNLGLNLLLIPRFGGEGAAWAGVAAQALSLVVSTAFHPSLRWVLQAQLKSLFAPWVGIRRYLSRTT